MTKRQDIPSREQPRQLLTEAEVAHLLRCTTRTVANMAARGELSRIRIGRRMTRYRAEEVERLLTARTERVPA